jgi:hypothetical protein
MGKIYEIDANSGKEKGSAFCISIPRKERLRAGEEWVFLEVYVPANWLFTLWQFNLVQGRFYRRLVLGIRDRDTGEIFYYKPCYTEGILEDGNPLASERKENAWIAQFGLRNNDFLDATDISGYYLISIEEEGLG